MNISRWAFIYQTPVYVETQKGSVKANCPAVLPVEPACGTVEQYNETVEQYKVRLRRTALAIPEKVVRKTLQSIPGRARAVVKEKGGHIPMD